MFSMFNNVAPSYMCDINRISHRHNTRQSDSAYVVPRQGSKSYTFNGSKLWNELPTNVKHVQQKIRFKKECKALLTTRMKEKEEMNVPLFLFFFLLYFYYIFIVRVIIFYLFLVYIYLHVSLLCGNKTITPV